MINFIIGKMFKIVSIVFITLSVMIIHGDRSSAILSQQRDVEEEYLWSCALTGTYKEYSWDPVTLEPGKEDKGRQVKPSHRLFIKTAILMPSAKKDEVTVVEIESEGYNKQKVGYLH